MDNNNYKSLADIINDLLGVKIDTTNDNNENLFESFLREYLNQFEEQWSDPKKREQPKREQPKKPYVGEAAEKAKNYEKEESLAEKLKKEYEDIYRKKLVNEYVDAVINALEEVNDPNIKEKKYKFFQGDKNVPPAVSVTLKTIYLYEAAQQACDILKEKCKFDIVTATDETPFGGGVNFIMTL